MKIYNQVTTEIPEGEFSEQEDFDVGEASVESAEESVEELAEKEAEETKETEE